MKNAVSPLTSVCDTGETEILGATEGGETAYVIHATLYVGYNNYQHNAMKTYKKLQKHQFQSFKIIIYIIHYTIM